MNLTTNLLRALAIMLGMSRTEEDKSLHSGRDEPIPEPKEPPQMDTLQILSLLIPALTQIAHDAITGYYRMHGDQSANTYADATDAEKQVTAAAVTNHINGNPDTKTVPGIIVGTVVDAAKAAIETAQSPVPAPVIPVPEVTEIHTPASVVTAASIAAPTPTQQAEAPPPGSDYHPGDEAAAPHFPPM